jgi:hypothetical protein
VVYPGLSKLSSSSASGRTQLLTPMLAEDEGKVAYMCRKIPSFKSLYVNFSRPWNRT